MTGYNDTYKSNMSGVYVNGTVYIDNSNDLISWGEYCQVRVGSSYYFINSGRSGSLKIDPDKCVAMGKNRGYTFHLYFNSDTLNLETSEAILCDSGYIDIGTIYDGGYGRLTYFKGSLEIDGQSYLIKNDLYTEANQYYLQKQSFGNVYKPYSEGYIYFTVSVNQNFENNVDMSSQIQDSENMADVYCALRLPKSYSPTGKSVPIVMFCHGAGGMVTSNNAGELYNADKLVEGGYAVFDVNGSNNYYTEHSDHMGGPRVIEAYKKAFKYIKQNYNVEDRLFVHGHSMGGLTALNFAVYNAGIVKAVGVYYPVTDLYKQAWLSPWFGIETKIALAREYNFDDKSGNTYESDKLIGYNPINNNAVNVGDHQYNLFPVPLKIWHGNTDIAVSLSCTQQYVENIKNAGGRVHLRIVDNMGHDHNDMLHTEELMWFNRWND